MAPRSGVQLYNLPLSNGIEPILSSNVFMAKSSLTNFTVQKSGRTNIGPTLFASPPVENEVLDPPNSAWWQWLIRDLLHILSLPNVLGPDYKSDVRVKLYADDIKIYLEITNDTDCATLQTFIDKLTAWSHTRSWQLKLANNKCQHWRIGLSRAIWDAPPITRCQM